MISRVFIFYAVFYSVVATLIIILSFAIPVNPNCANQESYNKVKSGERPSAWDFIGNAWDVVINIATFGVGTRCDTPVTVSVMLGLFNLISWSILGVGIAFLIRGSS